VRTPPRTVLSRVPLQALQHLSRAVAVCPARTPAQGRALGHAPKLTLIRVQIDCSRLQLRMLQEPVDRPEVRPVAQQASGRRVPDAVRLDVPVVAQVGERLGRCQQLREAHIAQTPAAVGHEQVRMTCLGPHRHPVPHGLHARLADVQTPALATFAAPHRNLPFREFIFTDLEFPSGKTSQVVRPPSITTSRLSDSMNSDGHHARRR
jgi:hypothetical protein